MSKGVVIVGADFGKTEARVLASHPTAAGEVVVDIESYAEGNPHSIAMKIADEDRRFRVVENPVLRKADKFLHQIEKPYGKDFRRRNRR